MSPAYKRPKIIISEHTRTIQDRNNTEPVETNFNEFQADLDLHENVRNSLDKSNTMHYDNRQSTLDSEFTSVNTETAIECESVTHVTTKDWEQPVDSPLGHETDEILESSSSIADEIQKRPREEKVQRKGEEDISDDSEIFYMFSDIS